MKISVALAYYDGAEYIEEQLLSILNQFGEKDELILSVDRAFDGSADLLKGWEKKDSRVFLTLGPSKGFAKNYEHAIRMCSGDVIFLSGQDDIWLPDKIRTIKAAFHDSSVMAVLHNAWLTDENLVNSGKTLFDQNPPRPGLFHNLRKNSYTDCCMAFRRDLTRRLIPFPEQIGWCGFWVGITAELSGKIAMVEEPLMLYRRHEKKIKEEQEMLCMSETRRGWDTLLTVLRRKREWKNEENKN